MFFLYKFPLDKTILKYKSSLCLILIDIEISNKLMDYVHVCRSNDTKLFLKAMKI